MQTPAPIPPPIPDDSQSIGSESPKASKILRFVVIGIALFLLFDFLFAMAGIPLTARLTLFGVFALTALSNYARRKKRR